MNDNNWNNFPKIQVGNTVKITWDEKFYGNQETGTAILHKGQIFVQFDGQAISLDALRSNDHIEKTEIVEKLNQISVGQKVYFEGEKLPYVAKAAGDRFVILTKPFNLKKTVLYTIIDYNKGVRGTNNCVFNVYDYKKQADIEECLKDLESGETEVSHRNCVPLEIKSIQ